MFQIIEFERLRASGSFGERKRKKAASKIFDLII